MNNYPVLLQVQPGGRHDLALEFSGWFVCEPKEGGSKYVNIDDEIKLEIVKVVETLECVSVTAVCPMLTDDQKHMFVVEFEHNGWKHLADPEESRTEEHRAFIES